MQLDELTEPREYFKVSVTRTQDKQDQDYFKVETDVAQWASSEVEYQYVLENLVLKQVYNEATHEFDIDYCAMRIRNREDRFVSDHAWISWLRE